MPDVSPISPIVPSPSLPDSARKTAQEFEAVFLGQMTKLMMDSASQGSDLPGGHGEEMFRGILAEQMGSMIAHGRGIGLSAQVASEIIRLQGSVQP